MLVILTQKVVQFMGGRSIRKCLSLKPSKVVQKKAIELLQKKRNEKEKNGSSGRLSKQ